MSKAGKNAIMKGKEEAWYQGASHGRRKRWGDRFIGEKINTKQCPNW
jgi:hypothetical protein